MIKVDKKDINLKESLFSGQCFRMYQEDDGTFTVVLNDRVINVQEDNKYLIIKSDNEDNLKNVVTNYFDLDRDYDEINNYLIKKDKSFEEIIKKVKGYKILKQDSFEMLISYIISQNNNVKRIMKSIEKLSELYGSEIIFNDKKYYLFPKYEQIKNITLEELRNVGLGFRDKYVLDALKKYNKLKEIDSLNTDGAIEILMSIKGVGLKVASCILLFGYQRLDVFPIDTWVKKYTREKYNVYKKIDEFYKEKYNPYTGVAIQYIFHVKRNKKNN